MRLPNLAESGQINAIATAMGTAPRMFMIAIAPEPSSPPIAVPENWSVQKYVMERFLNIPPNWKRR